MATASSLPVRAQVVQSPRIKSSTKHKVAVAAGITGSLLTVAFIASSIGGWGVGKALDTLWDRLTKKRR